MKIRKTITIAALVGGMVMFTACGTSKRLLQPVSGKALRLKTSF